MDFTSGQRSNGPRKWLSLNDPASRPFIWSELIEPHGVGGIDSRNAYKNPDTYGLWLLFNPLTIIAKLTVHSCDYSSSLSLL
jgi:hypothetical protein